MSKGELQEAETLIKSGTFEEFYDVEHELGRGRFAIVKRCMDKQSGKRYAAKVVKKSRSNTHGRSGREQLLMEISILSRSTHPKMVRLYDVFETKTEMQIILEYAEGGDLHRHCIETDIARTEKEICYLIRQILEATRYLHGEKIVHLDLKPDNILLAKSAQVFPEIRLIDFGLSRSLEGPYSQFDIVGTAEYVSPEVLAFDPIDYGSDMWSIGVVTYVLLSGISPFAGDDVMETYANIGAVDYDFDCEEFDEISDHAIDFIERLLVRDPKQRMTAREALEHAWIKQLDSGVSTQDVIQAQKARRETLRDDLEISPMQHADHDQFASSGDSDSSNEVEDEIIHESPIVEISEEEPVVDIASSEEEVNDNEGEIPHEVDSPITPPLVPKEVTEGEGEMTKIEAQKEKKSFVSQKNEETVSLVPENVDENPVEVESPVVQDIPKEIVEDDPVPSSEVNGDTIKKDISFSPKQANGDLHPKKIGTPPMERKTTTDVSRRPVPPKASISDKMAKFSGKENESIAPRQERFSKTKPNAQSFDVGFLTKEKDKKTENKSPNIRGKLDRVSPITKSIEEFNCPSPSNSSSASSSPKLKQKSFDQGKLEERLSEIPVDNLIGDAEKSISVKDISDIEKGTDKQVEGKTENLKSKKNTSVPMLNINAEVEKENEKPVDVIGEKVDQRKESGNSSPYTKKAPVPVPPKKSTEQVARCPPETKAKPGTQSNKLGWKFEKQEDTSGRLSPSSKVSNKAEREASPTESDELMSNTLFKKKSEASDEDSESKLKDNDRKSPDNKPKSPPPPVAKKPKSPVPGQRGSALKSDIKFGQDSLSASPSTEDNASSEQIVVKNGDVSGTAKLPKSPPPEVAIKPKSRPPKDPPEVALKPKISLQSEHSELGMNTGKSNEEESEEPQKPPVAGKLGGGGVKFSLNIGGGGGSKKLNIGPLVSVADQGRKTKLAEAKVTKLETPDDEDEEPVFDSNPESTEKCDRIPEVADAETDSTQDISHTPALGDTKGKNDSFSRSRRSAASTAEDKGRKTYRRLYVTKVRNSKIYENDFNINTEAAKIAQRVDKDVLQVEVKLKSTDLKLLP